MKEATLSKLPKEGTVISNNLPGKSRYSVDESAMKKPNLKLIFVDEFLINTRPPLDYYRTLYREAGYSPEVIESLISGLSESSLYEGKTS